MGGTKLGRGLIPVSCHCRTNNSEAQWLKATTTIFFFSHQSAIWAGLRGDCSALPFATLSEAVGQVSVSPSKWVQLEDKREREREGELVSNVTLGDLTGNMAFVTTLWRGSEGKHPSRARTIFLV